MRTIEAAGVPIVLWVRTLPSGFIAGGPLNLEAVGDTKEKAVENLLQKVREKSEEYYRAAQSSTLTSDAEILASYASYKIIV